MSGNGYSKSGVDTNAADAWVAEIARITQGGRPLEGGAQPEKVVSGVGDYASIYALSAEQWIAASCDGIGTKLLWALEGLGSPEAIAQDLVAMNVNDLICVGARPLLFLDYLAVGSKDLFKGDDALLRRFLKGIHAACLESGCLLVGGETAQMPELYEPQHFDVAGFAIGTMTPADRLGVHRVRPGAELWGWTSSGPHSNGYTWLRQVFKAPADAAYIRETLMQPTRLYVRPLSELRASLKAAGRSDSLQAAYHITGSGLLNLLRAQPEGRSVGFELDAWPQQDPAWLAELGRRTKATPEELWSTFNGGFGMVLVLEAGVPAAELEKAGLKRLGRCIEEPVVRLRGVALE
jgi:phosphoribosylformylglycinamidine cyclo-ligase